MGVVQYSIPERKDKTISKFKYYSHNDEKMKSIKLSEYAKMKSVTYKKAWNRFIEGKLLDSFKDESGHIYVNLDENNGKKTIVYARVSSNERKQSLKEQQSRLEAYSKLNNLELIDSFKEIASGMNDNRPILNKILQRDDWDILVVENKDRLTRFGFNYIKTLCESKGKKIIVTNATEDDKEDLMKDLISIIYSFSARMYGLRRKKNKEEIIKFIES